MLLASPVTPAGSLSSSTRGPPARHAAQADLADQRVRIGQE
jgi:hypothetical protein